MEMRDISSKTLGSLEALLQTVGTYQRLSRGEWATFLGDLSWGIKLSTMQAQLHFLQQGMKKDITTPEIQWLARLVDCKGKEERSKAWEKKIMQHRISLKRKEIKTQRR